MMSLGVNVRPCAPTTTGKFSFMASSESLAKFVLFLGSSPQNSIQEIFFSPTFFHFSLLPSFKNSLLPNLFSLYFYFINPRYSLGLPLSSLHSYFLSFFPYIFLLSSFQYFSSFCFFASILTFSFFSVSLHSPSHSVLVFLSSYILFFLRFNLPSFLSYFLPNFLHSLALPFRSSQFYSYLISFLLSSFLHILIHSLSSFSTYFLFFFSFLSFFVSFSYLSSQYSLFPSFYLSPNILLSLSPCVSLITQPSYRSV